MTIEQARELIAAFGPNSVLYECNRAQEVVERREFYAHPTCEEFVQFLYTVEDMYAERMGFGREGEAFLAGIRTRLSALGYTVS